MLVLPCKLPSSLNIFEAREHYTAPPRVHLSLPPSPVLINHIYKIIHTSHIVPSWQPCSENVLLQEATDKQSCPLCIGQQCRCSAECQSSSCADEGGRRKASSCPAAATAATTTDGERAGKGATRTRAGTTRERGKCTVSGLFRCFPQWLSLLMHVIFADAVILTSSHCFETLQSTAGSPRRSFWSCFRSTNSDATHKTSCLPVVDQTTTTTAACAFAKAWCHASDVPIPFTFPAIWSLPPGGCDR